MLRESQSCTTHYSGKAEILDTERKPQSSKCHQIRCSHPREIQQHTGLSDTVNLISTPPSTTMECTIRKELVRIGNTHVWIGNALGVVDVIKQNSRHDRVGSLWSEDFIGFKVRHAFIGPCERAILSDRDSRCGRGNIGGDNTALAAGNDSTPVLHPLCQS